MVPLNLFSLVGVGIYKLSANSKIKVLVEPAEAHIESEEWVTSFEKRAKKQRFQARYPIMLY